MTKQLIRLVIFVLLALPHTAFAQVRQWRICMKPSNGEVVAVPFREQCKRRRIDITDSFVGQTGPAGPQGIQGPSGVDGMKGDQGEQGIQGASADPYGDGSEGDIDTRIVSDYYLNGSTAHYFRNITVYPGTTLRVPSGGVLRLTGDFTNFGTVLVEKSCKGGFTFDGVPVVGASCVQARIPSGGKRIASGAGLFAGIGGLALPIYSLKNILRPGPFGGGGGAASGEVPSENDGGGVITVLARGLITNDGRIEADGAGNGTEISLAGSGGGAGGIVLLASKTGIINTGVISVRGGKGNAGRNDSNISYYPGGGGGGGLVRYIAPVIQRTGAEDLSPGDSGERLDTLNNPTSVGGGGGGACAGNGGSQEQPGTAGIAIVTQADPTSIFAAGN